LYRRLGGPQGRPGRVRKISPPPGFDPRTVQPVASQIAIGLLSHLNYCGVIFRVLTQYRNVATGHTVHASGPRGGDPRTI
jgi:hypothetical protein